MKKIFLLATIIFPLLILAQQTEVEEEPPGQEEIDAAIMDAMAELFNNTAELQESYDFKGKVKMRTSGEEDELTFDLWLQGSGTSIGMNGMPGRSEMAEAFIVYEKDQNAMFICMEEAGTKYAMSMGIPQKDQDLKKIELTKEKGKKKILGYKCEKYALKGEYKSLIYWITQESSKELVSLSNALASLEIFKNSEELKDYGIILGLEEENHSLETIEQVEVAEVDMKATYSFDASEYEVMSMKELMEMQESLEGVPQD